MPRMPARPPATARLPPPGGRRRSRRSKNWDSTPGRYGAPRSPASPDRCVPASRWCLPPADAGRGDAFHVAGHGGGNGKLDGDIDAGEVPGGEAGATRIVELIELERNLEIVLGGKLFNELAHFPVADDGELMHAPPLCVRRLRGRERRRTPRAAR